MTRPPPRARRSPLVRPTRTPFPPASREECRDACVTPPWARRFMRRSGRVTQLGRHPPRRTPGGPAARRQRRVGGLPARVPAQGQAGQGVRPLALHRDGARAGGPPGAAAGAALLLPGGHPRPRPGPEAPGPLRERRVLPRHERGPLRLPAPALAAPARPGLLPGPPDGRAPRRRLHPGGGALVRVPVLDDRPRGPLSRDAGLLPARAREVGRPLRHERPRRLREGDLRPRLPLRVPAGAADGPPAPGRRGAHRGARRPALRHPGRDPAPGHAEPARRLRLRHRRQHDLPAQPPARQPARTW